MLRVVSWEGVTGRRHSESGGHWRVIGGQRRMLEREEKSQKRKTRQYLNKWLEGKLGIWGLTLKCQESLGPEEKHCFTQQSSLFSAHSPLNILSQSGQSDLKCCCLVYAGGVCIF